VEVPNNPAAALERLLWEFTQSGLNKFGAAWGAVLDAPIDSAAFVGRHSAVVGLVSDLQMFLEALPPDDQLRKRHLPDMPLYYNAVVWHGDWNAPVNIAGLIDETRIRLLGSLGDVIKYRGVVPEVSEADVTELRKSLKGWEDLLNEAVLPEGIAAEIRTQLATIHDLLGQVEKLGYGPVIKEVETLFGKAVRLAKYVEDAKKVATCATGLFEFLTHLHVGDYGQSANALVGAFSMMGEALSTAHHEAHPLKAIDSSQQPALEAKPHDIVDAEVVDEDESGTDDATR
jgi:hypothetical protein